MRQDDLGDAHQHVTTVEEEAEEQSVTEASRLSARLIYEVIRRDGEEELTRPKSSLFFSGMAAGIMISVSILAEAVLREGLPDRPWRHLLESLGYSLGFVVTILSRMQLFTENTITTVLPLLSLRTWACAKRMALLWGTVLVANIIGTGIAAAFVAWSGAVSAPVVGHVADISRHALDMGAAEGLVRAVPAGVLIAAIVWMLPSVHRNAFLIIVAFTWLIAAGEFAHIIAGSVEMWFLVLTGEIGLAGALRFFGPVLLGNVLGGTVVFALISWAQVRNEVVREERR